MTIKEAQETVDNWIKEYGVRYFSELTNMACLTEEVGELARIIARKYGDQSFKEGEKCDLSDEMADVFHSGTAMNENGEFITAGGRVLGVCCVRENLAAAKDAAYEACKEIHFEGMHMRTDIGARALKAL